MQVFHPNIDQEGKICLNILREDWKPVLSISSVIYGLQFLFLVSTTCVPRATRQRAAKRCAPNAPRTRSASSTCHAPCPARAAPPRTGPQPRRPAQQGGGRHVHREPAAVRDLRGGEGPRSCCRRRCRVALPWGVGGWTHCVACVAACVRARSGASRTAPPSSTSTTRPAPHEGPTSRASSSKQKAAHRQRRRQLSEAGRHSLPAAGFTLCFKGVHRGGEARERERSVCERESA